MNKDIEYTQVFIHLFDQKDLPIVTKVLANKYANNLNSVVSRAMHYMSFVYECMQMIQSMG